MRVGSGDGVASEAVDELGASAAWELPEPSEPQAASEPPSASTARAPVTRVRSGRTVRMQTPGMAATLDR